MINTRRSKQRTHPCVASSDQVRRRGAREECKPGLRAGVRILGSRRRRRRGRVEAGGAALPTAAEAAHPLEAHAGGRGGRGGASLHGPRRSCGCGHPNAHIEAARERHHILLLSAVPWISSERSPPTLDASAARPAARRSACSSALAWRDACGGGLHRIDARTECVSKDLSQTKHFSANGSDSLLRMLNAVSMTSPKRAGRPTHMPHAQAYGGNDPTWRPMTREGNNYPKQPKSCSPHVPKNLLPAIPASTEAVQDLPENCRRVAAGATIRPIRSVSLPMFLRVGQTFAKFDPIGPFRAECWPMLAVVWPTSTTSARFGPSLGRC